GPAQGGGVIVSPEGYILTAAHVAQRPGQIAIAHLHDGRTVRVRSLGMNREFDAGVMKILENQNSGNAWPHAAMGNSESLRLGSWCVAMGHPGGLDRERGAVARVGRVLENGSDAIVTDCALISGDSGGPLFDLKGRLIAVHSRIGNDIAANLHVPVDRYEDHWDRMVKGEAWGFLPNFKPWLGVSGSTSTETAMLKRVTPGSPAAKAGLKSEDIVLRFGATRISDFKSLLDAVAQTMPGEQVRVRVQRELRILDLNIEIGRQDDK
ncbi:MAG: trypsin-like peptidase domain-containing protein, partial [Planctomycetota bacterium]